MKKINIYLLGALIYFFLTGCKDPDIEYRISFETGLYSPGNIDISLNTYPGINVYVYETFEDYYLKKNHLYYGQTNDNGYISFPDIISSDSAWLHVEIDTLNNLRFGPVLLDQSAYYSEGGSEYYNEKKARVPLSTTPTKIEFEVLVNEQPAEGAFIQLFLSEESYLNGIPPEADLGRLGNSYGYLPNYSISSDFGDPFKGFTNSDGNLLLDNLEARKYWFKITYEDLSNKSVYSTGEALPENHEITNLFTINLK